MFSVWHLELFWKEHLAAIVFSNAHPDQHLLCLYHIRFIFSVVCMWKMNSDESQDTARCWRASRYPVSRLRHMMQSCTLWESVFVKFKPVLKLPEYIFNLSNLSILFSVKQVYVLLKLPIPVYIYLLECLPHSNTQCKFL